MAVTPSTLSGPRLVLNAWRQPLLRARGWAGVLIAFFTAQTLTQLLAIASGILFVRFMPVGEFALYALASSVVTFFAFVTDLGSTASLYHFFQRANREGEDFGRYVAAVLSLRRRAYLLGAAGVIAAFAPSALAKGFRPLDVWLAAGAVLLTVALQVGVSVRLLTLRLHDRYTQSYRAEVAGSALRLALALTMVGTALMRSWLGLLVAAAGLAVSARLARGQLHASAFGFRLRHFLAARLAGQPAPAAEAAPVDLRPYRRDVLRYLLPTLPSALYFSAQAPLVVWLAATFGDSTNIAQVGALGRLGLLVGIFGGLTPVLFLPRLARITDEATWRRRALQFGAVHLAIAAGLIGAAWIAPRPFLWVLGANYRSLDSELLLVLGGACASQLGGYAVSLCLSRNWTRAQPLLMVIQLVLQVLFVVVFDLSRTSGVLAMGLATSLVGLSLQVGLAVVATRRATATA